MIIFPGNALSGLLSRCSVGEDRDWEKAQMKGQQELNLICGHSVVAVSANDSAQRRRACNVQPSGRQHTYCEMNEPNNVKNLIM